MIKRADSVLLPMCFLGFDRHFNVVASLVAQTVKHLPTMWETQVQSLGGKDPLEKEMAAHSSILSWEIPWAGKPWGLKNQTWLSD